MPPPSPSLPRAYMELHGVAHASTVPQFAQSLHGATWSGSYLHRPPVCLELYMELTWSNSYLHHPPVCLELTWSLHGVTRASTVPQFAQCLHGATWSGSYLHRPPVCLELTWSYMEWLIPPPSPVCLELTWSYMEWLIPPPSPSLPRAYMELHGVAHASTVPLVCLELTWSYMEWLMPPLSPQFAQSLHGVTRASTVPQFAQSLHGATWSG